MRLYKRDEILTTEFEMDSAQFKVEYKPIAYIDRLNVLSATSKGNTEEIEASMLNIMKNSITKIEGFSDAEGKPLDLKAPFDNDILKAILNSGFFDSFIQAVK